MQDRGTESAHASRGGEEARERIFWGLRELSRTFEHLTASLAARLDLNLNDFRALEILILHQSMPAGRLAARLRLTTGAITGVIDRLEHSRHVTRTYDQDDRRKIVVQPTKKAVRDHGKAFDPVRADVDAFLAEYSDQDLQAIRGFLEKTNQALSRHT
ncbi:MAG: MarR family transcriptional regulator [Candidatus Dormibacteraeota bacterium]|nr:MarR family transcriptional regulator [Candidatus Dormibacteraeota bacterium]